MGFRDRVARSLSWKYSSMSKYSNLISIFLFGFEKLARKVKSPLKYSGESSKEDDQDDNSGHN
ncbi:hypothetical protein C5167_038960 [Papaver somniferum]|uniref:Uncharacterized protein n=1 Tax=Papaver somniferum TaxID=3469 RepID=A0A4Y7IAQ3_PAPSO|nr:hypothetical protein C5167_038960 [Papaver somniferum]